MKRMLEGAVLFVLLSTGTPESRACLVEVSGLFLVLYGAFRFMPLSLSASQTRSLPMSRGAAEWLGWMTRGQALCIPMIVLGLWLLRSSHCAHALAGRRKA